MALFFTLAEARSTLFHYIFDQPAGTSMAQTTPVVGNSHWAGPAISNIVTDGDGQLINQGTSGTGANNLAIGRILDLSLNYELKLGSVTFQNLAGSSDYLALGFRTTITGAQVGGSSRDHFWLRIGNLGGQSNAIDAQFGRNSGDTGNQRNDIAYAYWAGANGIHGEPAIGDFDGAGIPNLLEYALEGLDPAVPDASPFSIINGVQTLLKREAAVVNGSVRFTLQQSPDLGTRTPWQTATPDFEDHSLLRFPVISNPPTFYRVLVEVIP